jgi:hypothetical protein
LTTTFVDNNANKIHTVVSKKGGTKPIPPPPAPSPTGKCCFYNDATCSPGDTCCSAKKVSYKASSCAGRYGQKHNCQWTGTECVVGSGFAFDVE